MQRRDECVYVQSIHVYVCICAHTVCLYTIDAIDTFPNWIQIATITKLCLKRHTNTHTYIYTDVCLYACMCTIASRAFWGFWVVQTKPKTGASRSMSRRQRLNWNYGSHSAADVRLNERPMISHDLRECVVQRAACVAGRSGACPTHLRWLYNHTRGCLAREGEWVESRSRVQWNWVTFHLRFECFHLARFCHGEALRMPRSWRFIHGPRLATFTQLRRASAKAFLVEGTFFSLWPAFEAFWRC